MTRMNFPDTVTVYEVTYSEDYGKPTLDAGHEVKACFEQDTGQSHANFQDSITSDARLYLDPDDTFLTGKGYRIEGLMVKANFFGANDRDQHFKIVKASVMRDTLLGNRVQHVECDLEKVVDFSGASIS